MRYTKEHAVYKDNTIYKEHTTYKEHTAYKEHAYKGEPQTRITLPKAANATLAKNPPTYTCGEKRK